MESKQQIIERFKPTLERATDPSHATHIRLDRLAVLCGLDPTKLFSGDKAKQAQQAKADAAEVVRLRAEADARDAELAELREKVEAGQRANELAPVEEPHEEPAELPAEEPLEEPAELPAEEPLEEPAEVPPPTEEELIDAAGLPHTE